MWLFRIPDPLPILNDWLVLQVNASALFSQTALPKDIAKTCIDAALPKGFRFNQRTCILSELHAVIHRQTQSVAVMVWHGPGIFWMKSVLL